MPFPRNLETAISVESIIRKHGAVPATIGCLNGKLLVGMTPTEIEGLVKTSSVSKISRRDLAVVTARGLTGGTTIAGTMVLAHMAGIKVFATGVFIPDLRIILISGVGWSSSRRRIMYVCLCQILLTLALDISADLDELGRTPVAVICSGAKAILDLGRTLEYLETKGVTVTTLGSEGVDIPAFYSRESGMRV
jgi:pseudouridine-5'-phosphate glycosidase